LAKLCIYFYRLYIYIEYVDYIYLVTLSHKNCIFLLYSAFCCIREDCTFWNVVPDSAFTSFRMFQCKCTPDTQPKTVFKDAFYRYDIIVSFFLYYYFFVNSNLRIWRQTHRERRRRVSVGVAKLVASSRARWTLSIFSIF